MGSSSKKGVRARAVQVPDDDDLALVPEIGPDFLTEQFSGKDLIHCIKELLKNCRDWMAGRIRIFTADPAVFRLLDDGCGMDRANCKAFVSVKLSSARGANQSGRYGQGAKDMFYSHSKGVKIITAPADDPEFVYEFELRTAEYEEMIRTRRPIVLTRVPKTPQSWPHPFATGTDSVYFLANPESRAVLRGDRLAEELSASLSMKLGSFVEVDGKPLPEKKRVGEIFEFVEQVPLLGPVAFELYRPLRKSREEGLLLTGHEQGEVPFGNFLQHVGDLHGRIPDVYTLAHFVCGTISVPFFANYVHSDRKSFKSAIVDDPLTRRFVSLLQRFAPEVQRTLQIKLEGDAAGDSVTEVLDSVAALFNRRYDPKGTGPGTGPSVIVCPPGPQTPKSRRALDLDHSRSEFEPGEQIVIEARFRKDLAKSYDVTDLRWHTDNCRAGKIKREAGCIRMTARDVGAGSVTAELPGTTIQATCSYEVVPRRLFGLTLHSAAVKRGSEFFVLTKNSDKVEGEICWQLTEGVGELMGDGARAKYRATRQGHAVITVTDTANSKTRDTCHVEVSGQHDDEKVICIRGQWFKYQHTDIDPANVDSEEERALVIMHANPPKHLLMINMRASGFEVARAQGNSQHLLALAIAQEFPWFDSHYLKGQRLEDVDPRDMSRLRAEHKNAGFAIFEELMRGLPTDRKSK